MSFINTLLVISLLIVTVKSQEQILRRDKLLSGFTLDNTQCKHTYRLKEICDFEDVDCDAHKLLDPSKEVTEVVCDDSALEISSCKQYTAEVELDLEGGESLLYLQRVACVSLGTTVNNSGINNAAGITILIMVAIALVIGVGGLAFINIRLRRKMQDLESSSDATKIDNKHYTGTVNQGLDLEEGKTT